MTRQNHAVWTIEHSFRSLQQVNAIVRSFDGSNSFPVMRDTLNGEMKGFLVVMRPDNDSAAFLQDGLFAPICLVMDLGAKRELFA
jgi:hypothetical protein